MIQIKNVNKCIKLIRDQVKTIDCAVIHGFTEIITWLWEFDTRSERWFETNDSQKIRSFTKQCFKSTHHYLQDFSLNCEKWLIDAFETLLHEGTKLLFWISDSEPNWPNHASLSNDASWRHTDASPPEGFCSDEPVCNMWPWTTKPVIRVYF